MPIIVKENGGGTFVPVPPGVWVARCCDVVDLGQVESQFVDERTKMKKLQHKIRIVWQISDPDEATGKRLIIAKQYTASLNEKATLRHDLESWRGRAFNADELRGFDLDKLIGVACQVNVMHEASKTTGKVFANIAAIMPVPRKLAEQIPPVEGYIRVQDRPAEQATEPEPDDQPAAADFVATDEDVPFSVSVMPFLPLLTGLAAAVVIA